MTVNRGFLAGVPSPHRIVPDAICAAASGEFRMSVVDDGREIERDGYLL